MMLGLGVGIDYALFILARHRQNLAAGQCGPGRHRPRQRDRRVCRCSSPVSPSSSRSSGCKVSGIPMMTMMGYGSAIMVAVTMLASITLLPAHARRRQAPREQRPGPVHQAQAGLRPARRGRPGGQRGSSPGRSATAVAAALILGILAIPVFSMHLGFADAGNDAPDSTTRKAYDLMADGYGPGINGPLQVVLDADGAPTRRGDHRRRGDGAGRPSPASPRWTQPVDQRGRRHRDHHRHADHVTAGRAHRRAARARCATTSPRRRRRHRRRGVGHRLHGADRRRLVAAAGPDALVPRSRHRTVVPGADGRVPVGAGPAEGCGPQRARRRGGVRRRRRGLPVGLGREPDRRARDRADHAAGADADVRDPVRPLDGLRGLPDEPGARAVPASTATRSGPSSRASARRRGSSPARR